MERTWNGRLRRARTVMGVLVAALTFAAVAHADEINVTNNLVLNSSSATEEPGDTGTLFVYLDVATPDAQNGCNATGSDPMVVSVTSSDVSKVTINSPGSVTLIGCGTSAAQSIGYTVQSGATFGRHGTPSPHGGG